MLKTNDGRSIDVDVLSYDQLIDAIMPIDRDFAELLDEISQNNDNTKFYQAEYKFGGKIIDNGQFYLPLSDGGSIAFDDPQLPDDIKSALHYDQETEDPLGFVVSKSSEFYIPLQDRILPHAIIHAGSVLGASRAINLPLENEEMSTSVRYRNLNAGASSLFMLHKISNNICHSKLIRKYNLKNQLPQSFQEHAQIFIDIAKSAGSPWRSKIIYFPREWINKLKTMDYAKIAMHLMHTHRASYNIWHNLGQIWNTAFGDLDRTRSLTNLALYSRETTKHLFLLAANSAIGFRPAVDEEMAPIKLIQEAYESAYYTVESGNRKYSLVIMEPTSFSIRDSKPVYYSINHSTFDQATNENTQSKSNLALLGEISIINELYRGEIPLHNTKQSIPILYKVANETEFTFFHNNPIGYPDIKIAELIAESDHRFTQGYDGEFPKDSMFFKGCIRISRKS